MNVCVIFGLGNLFDPLLEWVVFISPFKCITMEDKIEILKKFEQQAWITKTKGKIKIKDLKLDHLRNIVKNLRTRFDSLEDPMNDYPSFGGEMAQMYGIQQWEASMQSYKRLERTLQLFECYYKLKSL